NYFLARGCLTPLGLFVIFCVPGFLRSLRTTGDCLVLFSFLIIAVIQLFLLPLLPLLLFAGLFLTETNVFANYFKTFGMTIF
ncbi:hypothetical protein, partial [Enterococcus faecalis]|uniref:hypothetical protein n=1 Tax=Enterococcus faecalis TaxID=1351 RepID=UPI001561A9E4